YMYWGRWGRGLEILILMLFLLVSYFGCELLPHVPHAEFLMVLTEASAAPAARRDAHLLLRKMKTQNSGSGRRSLQATDVSSVTLSSPNALTGCDYVTEFATVWVMATPLPRTACRVGTATRLSQS